MPDSLAPDSPFRLETRSASPAVSGSGTPLGAGATNSYHSISVGCIVTVLRDSGPQQAEVLMTRPSTEDPTKVDHYVHYISYNKRLDGWIKQDQIDLTAEVIYPKLKKSKTGLGGHGSETMGTP